MKKNSLLFILVLSCTVLFAAEKESVTVLNDENNKLVHGEFIVPSESEKARLVRKNFQIWPQSMKELYGIDFNPHTQLTVNSPEGLRVRDKPSLSSNKICLLENNECLFVEEFGDEVTIDGIFSRWVKISIPDKYRKSKKDPENGWVFGGYLKRVGHFDCDGDSISDEVFYIPEEKKMGLRLSKSNKLQKYTISPDDISCFDGLIFIDGYDERKNEIGRRFIIVNKIVEDGSDRYHYETNAFVIKGSEIIKFLNITSVSDCWFPFRYTDVGCYTVDSYFGITEHTANYDEIMSHDDIFYLYKSDEYPYVLVSTGGMNNFVIKQLGPHVDK